MYKIVVLCIIALAINGKVFPPPVHEQYYQGQLQIANVCNLYHIPSEHPMIQSGHYFTKILKRLNKNIECPRQLVFNEKIHVGLSAVHHQHMKSQSYEIHIDQNGVELKYGDYSGYVYALESLSQLFKNGKVPFATIKDQPLLQYRGIMIDSARHYLSVDHIKRLVQSMPLSKLNILHWHIIDDQSFPLVLDSHPELAEGANYSNSKVYTKKDVAEIIALAQKNAVQIVPEMDTPAHSRSWGQSAQWKAKDISIKCSGGTGYNGQLDLSIPQSFTLVKDVIRQVDKMFNNSPYIHLGGDQVFGACWDKRPAIQTFMKSKNINSYGELQMYWRKQIKSVLSPSRKVVFWRNDAHDITTSADEIVQFWGSQADASKFTANSTSKIVMSPFDLLYLNKGQGNIWLNTSAGSYSVWRSIYEKLTPYPAGVDKSRILGATACLWGQVSNEDTLQNNLWMRATAFASRVWSEKVMQTHQIVASLVKIQYTLYDMNVDASPITSEFCQRKPEVCFPPTQTQSIVTPSQM